MKYYPVCLDIRNRDCLVVGGGAVAHRKVKTLLECGANVTVVSPAFASEMEGMDTENLRMIRRPYAPSDVKGRFLVIGATDDEAENRKISRDAEDNNVLCNIADLPDACNFILPSIVKRGDLLLAISTCGNSPAFAKHLRKNLEKAFGEEYTEFLQLMGAVRKKLLETRHAPEEHKPLFEALINQGLLEMVKEKKTKEINQLLYDTVGDILGDSCDYEKLMECE
ncbi:MAG: bifunctional precorrin-2 dehydrogenase/sirohydrochlorin ferrochelatase [Desulfosalsimonadaceae bacterium]